MSGDKNSTIQLGLFLGIMAAVAAALLGMVDSATQIPIKNRQAAKTETALQQVLPTFEKIDEETTTLISTSGWPIKYYTARKNGEIIGFAGEVITPEGFSGEITAMVGLHPDGTVRKVVIVKHTETPGLGTIITDRKTEKTLGDLFTSGEKAIGLPPNAYLDQYEGRKSANTPWTVNKDGGDVDAKTGATITSRAVCGAVYAVSATCQEHLKELSKGAE